MSRQDQYNVTLTVTRLIGNTRETKALGTFDKLSGGEKDSEETKYRPGNMQPPVTLGGGTTVGNVTVSRLYDLPRDHTVVGWLLGGVGKADVVVSKQPLDVDGNAYGKPITYAGKLKRVTPPEHDSESSDAALIEIEISSATMTV